VALPPFTVAALREWRTVQARERLQLGAEYEDNGFVFSNEFGRPLEGANLYSRNFRRVMERAGLGEWGPERARAPRGPKGRRRFNPKYRLYDLRHSAATLLLRSGVHPKVVSERLGHATVAFTLDVYSASLPDMQKDAADAMEAALGGGGA
jgi:integrase